MNPVCTLPPYILRVPLSFWSLHSVLTKKSVTANSVFISLFGDIELQVSACYGHHQAPLKNMNIETLLSEMEGLPLHNGAKIYSIVYSVNLIDYRLI
jgi:hypothetical protein